MSRPHCDPLILYTMTKGAVKALLGPTNFRDIIVFGQRVQVAVEILQYAENRVLRIYCAK